MSANDEDRRKKLEQLMSEEGLTPETLLYRHTLPSFLGAADADGKRYLSANPNPSEAVQDVYGEGHMTLAARLGPGLAFVDSAGSEWDEEERVEVAMRLGDALDQGGLIYPAESIVTARAWFVTLPDGGVAVTQVASD